MTNIPVDVKKILIEQKISAWRNTLYANELDAKTAQIFVDGKMSGGNEMLEAAKNEMKKCLAAIDALEKELKGLTEVE